MQRLFLLTFLLAGVIGTASGKEIQTIESWSHYRELLEADGMSAAEADADVFEMLDGLASMDRSAGNDRIGVTAPSFDFDAWLTEPMTLEDLRGQVLLVRWWTDTCPFCASSAPALRAIHDQYASQGVTVVGVFHPKAGRDDPLDMERVRSAVQARGFEFPIAVDWDWRNRVLKDWWLTGPDRPATSVTFLVDKAGVIRYVHPGMEYHDADGPQGEAHAMCATDMSNIRATIEALVAEPGPEPMVAAH